MISTHILSWTKPRIQPLELIFSGLAIGVAITMLLPYLVIILKILQAGVSQISWDFIAEVPRMAGRRGGILPILVSTMMILGVTLLAVIPLGLGAAIFLSDVKRKGGALAHVVNLSLDVLAGTPSIVFGLFGNAFFCVYLHMGFSLWSGGLTLACMALPLFVRAAEVGLSAVPEAWRHGAAALGFSPLAILRHIVLPVAAPAIALGIVLSTARALAETAALVYTSGYVDRMPSSFSDSGRALSVHIYELSMNVAGGEKNAYATAIVLLFVIGVINALTYILTKKIMCRGMRLS